MSRTYSIACKDCRKHLWIAQASGDHKSIYSGDASAMGLLRDFLFEHEGHNLIFANNVESELEDFEEIERPDYKPFSLEGDRRIAGAITILNVIKKYDEDHNGVSPISRNADEAIRLLKKDDIPARCESCGKNDGDKSDVDADLVVRVRLFHGKMICSDCEDALCHALEN